MIRQLGRIMLLAIMVLINTACTKYRTTQNEDFRGKGSHQFMDDA